MPYHCCYCGMFVTPALWYRITRVVLDLGSLNGGCVPNANVWLFVYFVYCFGWCGGATSKAFGLAISRSRVQILLEATLRNNLRQVVHTCASVAKQHNLVSAKGR